MDGQLDDLIIDPADDRPAMGAIYRAKAGRPMKGQGEALFASFRHNKVKTVRKMRRAWRGCRCGGRGVVER